jgi:hypothetical protein
VNKLFSSAIALAAVIPSVLISQNPAPARAYADVKNESVVAPIARRMAFRAMVEPRLMAMMPMDAASMFLGCTGELQLTDMQVTKLAAIARRSQARQAALRSRVDSAVAMGRASDGGQDGAGPMVFAVMRRAMPTDAERKAQHEDDRDAFAVLTPDQLATAWETMGARHEMKMELHE